MNAFRFNFILLHLIISISVITNLLTGLRIHLVSDQTLSWLSPFLPQGQLHNTHYISGIVITATVLGYVLFLLYYRKRATKPTSRYHHIVQYAGYITTLSALISGGLYWWQPNLTELKTWHFASAISMLLFLLLHSATYLFQYGLSILKRVFPLRALVFAPRSLSLFLVGVLTTGIWFWMQALNQMPLQVHKLNAETLINIDGYPDESFWREIPSVSVQTTGGANFDNGSTIVSIKAAANKQETYFLFRWKDETRSLNHLPLIKQNGQWAVQQNGFHRFDETTYYEDKFAVMVSSTCGHGADGTAHLGNKPIKDKPANWHGKGYHASTDGKIRDLWHWKAVRTNDMFQADDNFFGPASKPRFGERRYTAGYLTDGKDSGGYKMNWKWYSPTNITPKRLPTQEVSTQVPLAWFGSKPYQQENDTYPDGSELPSVLYRSNQFEGDRADVRARGTWQDGYWTLELSRRHDTDSSKDVALKSGTCIWVSAFDRSQVAHTRHHRPFQLEYL